MKSLITAFGTVALFCVGMGSAQAKLLQIIHTNDLHSHFEHSDDPKQGSYAALKRRMDGIRAEAAGQGIETLQLDAGDFGEGQLFFFARNGRASWQILQEMGYDAVTVGNHDYLMGPTEMDALLGEVQPRFPVLAANFQTAPGMANLAKYVQPYVILEKAGLKIGVIGLTTDEFVYTWRAKPGQISAPEEALIRYLPELEPKVDFIIALTHLGANADRELIKKFPQIGLIVGGHSHTRLTECNGRAPCQEKNPRGEWVPVVQAGQHAEVVGDLLVDIQPHVAAKAVHYVLRPVTPASAQDGKIRTMVGDARKDIEARFGADWLHESLGETSRAMTTPKLGPSAWGNLVGEAMRLEAGADVSIDGVELFGYDQPAGTVTREKIFNLYPRIFSLNSPSGWTVWSGQITGEAMKFMVEQALNGGLTLNLSGATFEQAGTTGDYEARNFKVGGQALDMQKAYRVAFSEGIGRALGDLVGPDAGVFLAGPTDTQMPIWTAIERRWLATRRH